MYNHPGGHSISLITECTTKVNLANFVLCLTAVQISQKPINKEFLSRSDLTNQIIGVLTRFCEEKIDFMEDVEAIYYQVQVPENQQSFLKFLWWENHDMEKYFQYVIMCLCVWFDIVNQPLKLCLAYYSHGK